MIPDYRYKVGQEVDIFDGWELPLWRGTIKNRRRKTVSASSSGIVFTEEYLITDKYATEEHKLDVAALGAISEIPKTEA